MSAKVADAAQMQQESLFEYHLYTLQRPTTLAENQTKQVALMSATAIPAKKEFVLEGASHYYSGQYSEIGQKIKVGVFVCRGFLDLSGSVAHELSAFSAAGGNWWRA